jgi:hypothetical protein
LLRRKYPPYLTRVPLTHAALRVGEYDVAHAVHTADALAVTWWKRSSGRLGWCRSWMSPTASGSERGASALT